MTFQQLTGERWVTQENYTQNLTYGGLKREASWQAALSGQSLSNLSMQWVQYPQGASLTAVDCIEWYASVKTGSISGSQLKYTPLELNYKATAATFGKQYQYQHQYQDQYQYAYQNALWYGSESPETGEQRAERQRLAEIDRAKRQVAKQRAERLLFTILTPSQVKQYTDDGCFEQEVGGRIYRLYTNSRSQNVILLEDGKPKVKYCAHPADAHATPIPDVLLSQLLMLKANEAEFLRIANRTDL